jgi:hypothetical protein
MDMRSEDTILVEEINLCAMFGWKRSDHEIGRM